MPVIGLLVAVAMLVGVALAIDNRRPRMRAIIVDQLSLTTPDEAFVLQASATLRQAGYEVDYVSGTDVTVRFYQGLPLRQDDLILLRVHSARISAEGSQSDDVALFTGELIDLSRYELDLLPDGPATAVADALATRPRATGTPDPDELTLSEISRLIPVFYDRAEHELPWFGVLPTFVERDLRGTFKDSSVVVLMGCDGLRSNRMAEAFLQKGAGTFISWDKPVSGPHTDAATARLLALMLRDGLPIPDAVSRTMAELGPDPDYGARMVLAAR